jgi:hypothetical protein
MRLENTIVYLIGSPGAGKLTVAKLICQRANAMLVDNHTANNPIFSIIGAGGETPIPEAAWDRIKAIRDIIFDTILNVSPRHFSFVLPNVLLDDQGDEELFEQVKSVAVQRCSFFVPAILTCDEEELCRRVSSSERAENYKETDSDLTRKRLKDEPLLPVQHPHLLTLDTTHLSAEATADKILNHIAGGLENRSEFRGSPLINTG